MRRGPEFIGVAGSSRDWEVDTDVQAAVGLSSDDQAGLVGVGDGRDDGEPEAQSAGVARPAGGGALEWLEQP